MATPHKRVIKDISDGRTALKKEFGIYLEPEENDFYRVHFVLPGPEDTPFEGGLYHGMIRLNENHPYKPPNIHMVTPNGRFVAEGCPIPNGSRGICTTTSSFHPETWTPMNNLETVIKGFVSLMCDPFDHGVGAIDSTDAETRNFAKESIKHIKTDTFVKNLFPDLHQDIVNGKYQQVKLGDLAVKAKPGPVPEKKKIVIVDDFEEEPPKKPLLRKITKKETIDSESDEEPKPKPKPKKKAAISDDESDDSENDSENESEEESDNKSEDDTEEESETSSDTPPKPKKKPAKKKVINDKAPKKTKKPAKSTKKSGAKK